MTRRALSEAQLTALRMIRRLGICRAAKARGLLARGLVEEANGSLHAYRLTPDGLEALAAAVRLARWDYPHAETEADLMAERLVAEVPRAVTPMDWGDAHTRADEIDAEADR